GRLTGAIATGCTLLVCGCGSVAVVPQAGTQRPVAAASVELHASGSPAVDVDPSSLTVRADEAGLLSVSLAFTSHAAARSTVTMTATLRDAAAAVIGHATGGAVDVDPGTRRGLTLTGALPSGVVTAADLVVAVQPAPTPRP
ncbi:MAG TPA: hypothetical protein VFO60_06975, partial [Candidatus Dormibacteraeota bacterium]|nr:hypothetical protein [Candidatus Dormibacteraeota bacterium]